MNIYRVMQTGEHSFRAEKWVPKWVLFGNWVLISFTATEKEAVRLIEREEKVTRAEAMQLYPVELHRGYVPEDGIYRALRDDER